MSKSERLVWAIDCDDVLVPTAQAIIDKYNSVYKTSVTLEEFYSESKWGAPTEDDAIKRVDSLLRAGVTAHLKPNPQTIDAIHRLPLLDELHLVTGRQTYMEPETQALLDQWFNGMFTSIEHTNFYSPNDSLAVKKTKGEVCASIGADVLLDDHVIHGESVLAAGVKEVIIWGNYPWNQKQKLSNGMVRCTNWDAVFQERARILNSRYV